MADAPFPANAGRLDRSRALPGATGALFLLLAINLFNYVDRQVLAAVEPDVRRHLLLSTDPDDPNARAKMGLLSTAFLVSYMCTAPLFGWLSERRSRWLIVALGVSLWSIASGASGLAMTFGVLLITRCFVGLGEAAYGPVAPTIIADYYPVAKRGRVLAIFYMAIPVGGALGYALGGQFAGFNPQQQSWRWAFYAVVIPGLLLGLLAFLKRDPKLGGADSLPAPARPAAWRDYLALFRIRSYVFNTLGMAAMTFAIGAFAWWMPDYLEMQKAESLWGIDPRTLFGVITALAGLVATLLGGLVGDMCRGRVRGAYFIVSGVGLIVCCPCTILFLCMPFPWAWLFIFFAVFFLFFNTGPTNTILANVTHPSIRATAFAVNIFVIHILGDAISPPIIGAVTDRSARFLGYPSLVPGFVVVSLFMVLGGAFWIWGARYLDRDTELAPQQLP
jgi:MFS family permease